MTRWFRFYDDAVNDPKVQRLPGEKFKAWVNLLCLASRNGGVLPPLVDIAFTLRMSDERVSSLLDELCAAGLIDPVEVDDAPMSYEPHNWSGRQYKSDFKDPTAADRQQRYRDRKRNDRNATVTDKRPETDTETDTEKKDAAGAASTPEKVFFDQASKTVGRSLAAKLLKSKDGNVALAHAALLTASTKSNAREYLGAIIRSREEPGCRPDRSF